MSIIVTGECNRQGCCCLFVGKAPMTRSDGQCSMLLPLNLDNHMDCEIRLDHENNMTIAELREKWGDSAIDYYLEFCGRDSEFPLPHHFGDDTEEIMMRFKKWKEDKGCTFDFNVI